MHLQEKNHCCHFQMKYGYVVLGTCSAYKKKKKSTVGLLLIIVMVMNDPENGLVLSQELPQVCSFFMRWRFKKMVLTLHIQ